MAIELKVPALPESVTDAVVATWHKQPGDAVEEGDNLVDLETDKVMLEVPAPASGVLESIAQEEGATVSADTVLGVVAEGQQATATKSTEASNQASSTNETQEDTAASSSASKTALSPSARRAASETGVDVAQIKGSGKGGRVTRSDIESSVSSGSTAHSTTASVAATGRGERRVPMTRMRATIAKRLLSAKNNTAMLTTFNELNMQPVMDIRSKYKDLFIKTHDVKLGMMSFFIKAAVAALKKFPAVNASIDGNDIVYHEYFDMGVAISAPRGLVVPVLRDVDQMSMAEIEKSIIEFASKAKENKLTVDEMMGGTFTVTNGGVFGSMLSTPLLNPPQSAILGMHNIVQRPVVENNEIVIRPMMYLALSYDHQLVDGRESVQFLLTIKQLLENPERFLLDI
jgi:2-oxoglutarate dehydrogenase E2 component (dihydrolipoamide succinyltransferase)